MWQKTRWHNRSKKTIKTIDIQISKRAISFEHKFNVFRHISVRNVLYDNYRIKSFESKRAISKRTISYVYKFNVFQHNSVRNVLLDNHRIKSFDPHNSCNTWYRIECNTHSIFPHQRDKNREETHQNWCENNRRIAGILSDNWKNSMQCYYWRWLQIPWHYLLCHASTDSVSYWE